MSVGVAEICGDRPAMIGDPERMAAVAQAERLGVLQESHEPGAGDLERYPVPSSGSLWALRLAREQGELRGAAVRGDHQRPTWIGGPCLGPRHGLEAKGTAVPGGSGRAIRDEELDVIQLERGKLRVRAHRRFRDACSSLTAEMPGRLGLREVCGER